MWTDRQNGTELDSYLAFQLYARAPVVSYSASAGTYHSPKLSRCSGSINPSATFSSTATCSGLPTAGDAPSPLTPMMTLRRGASEVFGSAQCQTACGASSNVPSEKFSSAQAATCHQTRSNAPSRAFQTRT